jgi:septal ring factor EnvC (AmiA/AmiB activator)
MKIGNLESSLSELKTKNTELEKMLGALQEMLNLATKNVGSLEGELRERKAEYQTLLNQKAIMEKENLMLKKDKTSGSAIRSSKCHTREINNKIDKLIEL